MPSARSHVLEEHICGCSVGTAWEDVRAIGVVAQQIAARLPLLGEEVRVFMRETEIYIPCRQSEQGLSGLLVVGKPGTGCPR